MTGEQPPSLSEAELRDRVAETRGLLHREFHIATPEQHACLETELKDLQNVLTLYDIIASLREALTKEGEKLRHWKPTDAIERVVRACCDQRYEEHDVEYIFYKHGGINGLFILFLGTKNQSRIFSAMSKLPTNMIADLAEKCGKEKINSVYATAWIKSYNTSQTNFDPKDLPRLYRWGKVKETRDLSLPSKSRKRARSGNTSSDMQIKSTEIDTPPSLENLTLHFDYQQQQRHSPALGGDTAPQFDATLPGKQVSTTTQTSAVPDSEFPSYDSWAWTQTGIDFFIPRL